VVNKAIDHAHQLSKKLDGIEAIVGGFKVCEIIAEHCIQMQCNGRNFKEFIAWWTVSNQGSQQAFIYSLVMSHQLCAVTRIIALKTFK